MGINECSAYERSKQNRDFYRGKRFDYRMLRRTNKNPSLAEIFIGLFDGFPNRLARKKGCEAHFLQKQSAPHFVLCRVQVLFVRRLFTPWVNPLSHVASDETAPPSMGSLYADVQVLYCSYIFLRWKILLGGRFVNRPYESYLMHARNKKRRRSSSVCKKFVYPHDNPISHVAGGETFLHTENPSPS